MRCLVIGGGGPVGIGLLYLFRELGWRAFVVDPKQPKHMAHHKQSLAGTLLDWDTQPCGLDTLELYLEAQSFDAVVDLSPKMDKSRSITVCDRRGISLVNSTMVDSVEDIHVAAYNFLGSRPDAKRRPHIVASGMNPGAINAMAEDIIRKHGRPDAICYWEYDDTAPADGVFRRPGITWCPGESSDEIDEDWTFEILEEGTILMHEDALSWHPQSYRCCGAPVDCLPIPTGSEAFLIGHEECVYMGWRHDTACKFIYGFHPDNMKLMREASYGFEPELLLCKPEAVLCGRDIVGVSCQYSDNWVGQYCTLDNAPDTPVDTNATCLLVASGVAAALQLLQHNGVEPGVHLTHELNGFMPAFRSLAQVHEFLIAGGQTVALHNVQSAPFQTMSATRKAA